MKSRKIERTENQKIIKTLKDCFYFAILPFLALYFVVVYHKRNHSLTTKKDIELIKGYTNIYSILFFIIVLALFTLLLI